MKHMLEKPLPEKLTGQLKKLMAATAAATMLLPGDDGCTGCRKHT